MQLNTEKMIKEYQLQKKQNSFEVTLHYKGVKVRVAFTGGNVYNGTRPRFRTNDLFKMKAIEASELFKTKEVVVIRTIQETHQSPTVVQRKRVVKCAPSKAVRDTKPTPAPAPVAQEPVAQAPVQKPVVDDAEGGDKEGEKTFANLGEAILYIAQNWQITVQTEKEARDVLKEHGINPKIKRG